MSDSAPCAPQQVPADETLASINEEIKELVRELNELIDEDFAIQDTQRTLDYYTELNERFSASYHAFVNQLIELRSAYVGLNNKFRGNEARTMRIAQKLYASLLKRYDAEAKQSNELMRPIEEWDIAQEFPVPKSSLPKQSDERSKAMVKLSHKLFNARYHHRARSHWTLAGAKTHRNELRNLLTAQQSKHDQREHELRRLELSITMAKEQIESYRRQLLVEPPHNIWTDAYEAHASFVREILAKIHSESCERVFEQETSRRADYLIRGDARWKLMPAVSSLRRMSGPDINEVVPPATLQPAHSTSLRGARSFHVQRPANVTADFTDSPGLKNLFDHPQAVRHSKSASLRSHDQGTAAWGLGTTPPAGSVPFPPFESRPVAPTLAATLRDLRYDSTVDEEQASPQSVYCSGKCTPDTPAEDDLPSKVVTPLRISRVRGPAHRVLEA